MTRITRAAAVALISAVASDAARACGGVGPVDDVSIGGNTEIRGYGYDLDGDRAVTLKWASDGSLAAVARVDENGDFHAVITAPDRPGIHRLIVSQGSSDPTPALVSIPVVASSVALALPHAAGLAFALLAAGALLGAVVRILVSRNDRPSRPSALAAARGRSRI